MDIQSPDRSLAPEDMLCFDVYTLQQAFGRLYTQLLRPLGLTYPQYLAISCLWSGSEMAVGQIGARLGLETSTLTPLLKRLEAQGLVTRRRSTEDERRMVIQLTEAGRALEARARDIPRRVADATGMSEDEMSDLRRTLARLRLAILDHSAAPSSPGSNSSKSPG